MQEGHSLVNMISADSSCLLIVDVQERLLPSVHEPQRVITSCNVLIQAASLIGISVVLSEQYAKGLGSTVSDIKIQANSCALFFGKTAFSCAADTNIVACLNTLAKKQIIIAGIETHICVLQSALGLKEKNFSVFVVSDACSTRHIKTEEVALSRMTLCGVHIVTTEMVLFEWLRDKRHLAFKSVQGLIK